jgi:hypothetical protein
MARVCHVLASGDCHCHSRKFLGQHWLANSRLERRISGNRDSVRGECASVRASTLLHHRSVLPANGSLYPIVRSSCRAAGSSRLECYRRNRVCRYHCPVLYTRDGVWQVSKGSSSRLDRCQAVKSTQTSPPRRSVQGTTISQNRLEPSTSVIRGVTLRLTASFSRVALSAVVARKPSLQTIIPLPVAW